MSILETTLVFAAIPLAIYAVCALATLRSKFAGRPRYRPGQEWDYPPVWWTGAREGAGEPHADGDLAETAAVSKVRGGARGSW